MRDKRPVDELSIEELERILAIKRREARQQQIERMRKSGRVVEPQPLPNPPPAPVEETPEAPRIAPSKINPTKQPKMAEIERLAMIEQGLTPMFEDELVETDDHDDVIDVTPEVMGAGSNAGAAHTKEKRKWFDRTLLLVEVAAVVGIVVIGVNLVSAIGKLESETASAQALADEVRRAGIPTIEPTPTLRLENIVLPGGHTSPLAPGGADFNYEEVPAIYRPLVQSQWMQPVVQRPPVTSETALSINIPRINIDATIVQGVDWEALKAGVGQLPNGVNPSDVAGNVVFAAHNDIYGELFRYLDLVQIGDPFQIRTASQVYNYVVTDVLYVDPNDVYVLENRGGATATLISCYPYQVNNKRIIIFADRVGTV
jgi:sortase A